jgi:dihydropteroate synthase
MTNLRLAHRRGELRVVDGPALMGIVNVTPDSFSDGGRYLDADAAVEHALRLVDEGAHVVDIGGESTRPGAAPVADDEEIDRVVPVVAAVRRASDVVVSVDTSKASVARAALAAGADIVNDVTGLRRDPAMAAVVAEAGAGIVLMHGPPRADALHEEPEYDDVAATVAAELLELVAAATRAGIARDHIAVDPGFGFGKNATTNHALLAGLEAVVALGYPVLVGVSRKRMIRAATGPAPRDVEFGTAAANVLAVLKGAHLLRVHDVAATRAALAVVRSVAAAHQRAPATPMATPST